MIGLIHYGSGNIYAIANIYKRLDIDFAMMSDPLQFKRADKLILPGVGAFDETMQLLNVSGIKEELDELVLVKKMPVMGICVGMQVLGKSSEEGQLCGLGWIDGVVKKLDVSKLTRKPHLPHLGWNSVNPTRPHPLFEKLDSKLEFYFLHSYCLSCANANDVLAETYYGNDFASAIHHENIFGVQFHPEKSHANGIRLLKNYANL